MISRDELLAGLPPARPISPEDVRTARARGARPLIVLDDDPTGTQSVAGLPVLNAWAPDDLEWALGTGAAAVYVMTNSRSLDPEAAARCNVEVVSAALEAARRLGIEVDVVSRGDSTLRGHFPLEPDTIRTTLAEHGIGVDGVVVVPAFGDAGRITVNSVHYAGNDAAGYLPVGETEFARDATFGYRSSDLRDWVAEKTGGRVPADQVATITLSELRSASESVAATLEGLSEGRPVVVDIVEEADLRALALALLEAQARGKRFVFRVGPPFVRAMIGQAVREPLTAEDVASIRPAESANGGLIVVGSHVGLTTRQLDALRERRAPAEFEIDVATVLTDARDAHLSDVIDAVSDALTRGNAVVRTSRTLVKGADGDDSLRIARAVSDAVVQVVRTVLDRTPPRFVIAKGGITSSDVAARGLEIGRAIVRGPMLPGIVSLWEPITGPARGVPYIVFAGNVGGDQSLADVADKLSD
ncbi:four-carbon acid sugar kinase family protein [Micropruina sp.]|uniref:four-carbon acid sugar kinase family protein n=1 Tax=Micropruina sp. TaxID=2737536 RepID=UPI0039E3C19D